MFLFIKATEDFGECLRSSVILFGFIKKRAGRESALFRHDRFGLNRIRQYLMVLTGLQALRISTVLPP